MKKTASLALIMVLPFFLAACTTKPKTENAPKGNGNKPQTTQQPNNNESDKKADDSKNVFSSIKDALARNIALNCKYEDKELTGGVTVNTYIKGNMVYMESTQKISGKDINMQGIMRDNKYYVWSDASPQGMLFDLTKITEKNSATLKGANVKSTDDVINKLEENKQNCKPTTIEDSKFVVPTTIKFVEF